MKKTILVVLAISILGIMLFVASLGSLVKNGVETFGPEFTKTDVTLASASINPFSGHGNLSGLTVGSPANFNAEYSFHLDDIAIDIDVVSLLSNTIVIKNISITNPKIIYELGPAGLNIKRITDAASKASTQQNAEISSGQSNDASTSKKVIIEKLSISGGEIGLAANILGKNAGTTVPLPDITLTDIGKESNGTTFSDATKQVLKTVTTNINQADIGSLKGIVSGITNNSKNLLNNMGSEVEDTLKNAGDGLKNLFGGN